MKPKVEITNWSIVSTQSPYCAPEMACKQLRGNVVSHPKLGNKQGIVSSPIESLDIKARRVETYNTVYLLIGEPDVEWIKYLESINYNLAKLNT